MMKTKRKLMPGEIMTFSGRIIDPLNPDPDQIDIGDIAHSLANQCRFTGHTKTFYSVAQHSVLVSENCDPQDSLWGLLHDGTEAYLSDIARPIKKMPGLGATYTEVETVLLEAICDRFDLPDLMPDSVHKADTLLLFTEMRDLMPIPLWENEVHVGMEVLDFTILPALPMQAEIEFLERFKELT